MSRHITCEGIDLGLRSKSVSESKMGVRNTGERPGMEIKLHFQETALHAWRHWVALRAWEKHMFAPMRAPFSAWLLLPTPFHPPNGNWWAVQHKCVFFKKWVGGVSRDLVSKLRS